MKRKIYSRIIIVSSALAVLLISGCATKEENTMLINARQNYARVQRDPDIIKYAPLELEDAKNALDSAESSWQKQYPKTEEVNHLSYMAKQKSLISKEVAAMKMVDEEVDIVSAERDRILYETRSREAVQAKADAERARQELEAERMAAEERRLAIEEQYRLAEKKRIAADQQQRAAEEEQRRIAEEQRIAAEEQQRAAEAEQRRIAEEQRIAADEQKRAIEKEQRRVAEEQRIAADEEQRRIADEEHKQALENQRLALEEQRRLTEEAKKETQLIAAANEKARQDAAAAAAKAKRLEAQIATLQANQTERGLVLTLGDVLFDTDKSELKPGAHSVIKRISAFLKEYPTRKAQVEGFTDSIGAAEYNLKLSNRRAESVRNALNGQGISFDRILYRGYGEKFPVATNFLGEGRQRNRRVEVIISDEKGMIPERTK